MKTGLIVTLLIGLFVFAGAYFFGKDALTALFLSDNVAPSSEPIALERQGEAPQDTAATSSEALPARTIIARNLTIPWDLAFLPDGDLLVTERPGTLLRLEPETGAVTEIPVRGVRHTGEGGLLGIALHPSFASTNQIYLYRTSGAQDTAYPYTNEVVRYTLKDGELSDETRIIDGIPGASYHDGGRIAFGPDGLLYITTGDAGIESLAENLDSLAGKVLRLNPDGTVPADNPFGSPVYSYGHRNPQGLTWDDAGNLWSTEHGRSGIRSGLDELNRIQAGANYGWPESQGDTVRPGTVAPAVHSGSETTWAPASAAFYDGSIFFGGLRGEALFEAVLDGGEVAAVRRHLFGEYGRIRSVVLGPDGGLYLTTSNRDGRGTVSAGDDRIVRIDPASL